MSYRQTGEPGHDSISSSDTPPAGAVLGALASTRLTLWLTGILMFAMALGTLIPQGAPMQAYQRAFGELLGRLIARTSLSSIYGSWWFVALFAWLWINLAACAVQRVSLLLRSKQAGDAVASWGVVAGHCGVLIVLVGAAYGRWPSHTYSTVVDLQPGQEHRTPASAGGFGVRLLAAGSKQDESGRPTEFWARADLIEDGRVLRKVTIRPNEPLRHRAVSVVLQSLPGAGFAIAARRGHDVSEVPISLDENGNVLMMASMARVPWLGWLVFVHDLRSEGGRTSARVIVDRSGRPSPNWERVGWVDERETTFKGVSFRLVRETQGAQLSLDRDVGVPVVWLGFAVLTLGSLLACLRTKKTNQQGASQ